MFSEIQNWETPYCFASVTYKTLIDQTGKDTFQISRCPSTDLTDMLSADNDFLRYESKKDIGQDRKVHARTTLTNWLCEKNQRRIGSSSL